MRRFLFILVASVFFQTAAYAETIRYAIMQMGIKAGDAVLSVVGPTTHKGVNTFLITFKADGFNFLDEEQIYLDPVVFKPLFVERNLNIFGNKEKITEEYQADQGQIKVTKTVGSKVTEQVLKKSGVVDNIYGFIYRYRNSGSFKTGDVIDVVLPTKDIKIALVKQVQVQAAGKTYDSFYMQSKPSKYKIWFDTSDKKLPLRISGAVGIANTVMVMTGYER